MTDLTTTTQSVQTEIADRTDFPALEDDPAQSDNMLAYQLKSDWAKYDADELKAKIYKGCKLTLLHNRLLRNNLESPDLVEKEFKQSIKPFEVTLKEANTYMSLYAIADWILKEGLLPPEVIYSQFTSKALIYLSKVVSEDVKRNVVTMLRDEGDCSLSEIVRLTREAKVVFSDLPDEIKQLVEAGAIRKSDIADFIDVIDKLEDDDREAAIADLQGLQKTEGVDPISLKELGKDAKALPEIRTYFERLFSDDLSRETLDINKTIDDIRRSQAISLSQLAAFLKSAVTGKEAIAKAGRKLKANAKVSDKFYCDAGGDGSSIRKIVKQLEGVATLRGTEKESSIQFPWNDEGTEQMKVTLISDKK